MGGTAGLRHRGGARRRDGRGAVAARARPRRARDDHTWDDVFYEDRDHGVDLDLNLVIVGTSVTPPAPKFLRGGIEKTHPYHNPALAVDADTSEIVWY